MKPGTRLGDYEILAPLGAGGMGEVYRARDKTLDRDVAIKVLPHELAFDAEFLARFEREAKLLGSLNHPNIATLHAFGEDEGTRFLVMELVRGSTLRGILAEGPLTLERMLDVCGQIAAGLQAAHAHGVVHRDLKPANVMVTGEGLVKLLDFGLARSLATATSTQPAEAPTELTVAGVRFGTAPYMSPEQIRGEPVDARTDIWALGCLGYETLTGRRAFDRKTSADTMAAILETEPDWAGLPREIPVPIRDLLRSCLQRDTSLRPQAASEVRAAIEQARRSRRDVARPPSIRTASCARYTSPMPPAPICSMIL